MKRTIELLAAVLLVPLAATHEAGFPRLEPYDLKTDLAARRRKDTL